MNTTPTKPPRNRLHTRRPHYRQAKRLTGIQRICWLSDIHLSHLRTDDMSKVFGGYLRADYDFDSVVITGDIAEAHSLGALLKLFADGIGTDKEVFYTLGNHDYYGSTIDAVNSALEKPLSLNLTWLDRSPPILLDEHTALIGKFTWYDALLGDADNSNVILSDFTMVHDFKQVFTEYAWERDVRGRDPLLAKLRMLAYQAVKELKETLLIALKLRKNIIVATHVPPFMEACWHEGAISNERWLPWFTCHQLGKMLEQVSEAHPECKLLVLCGHTHSPGVFQRSHNLRVLTAKAVYGAPDVAGMLENAFDW